MCQICGKSPCHPRCPNAPDPIPDHRCSKCGEGIFENDEYAIIDGQYYCYDCIDNMAYCELIPLLGGEWHEEAPC